MDAPSCASGVRVTQRLREALVADARVTSAHRGERAEFRSRPDTALQILRLMWASDAFLAQALYRVKARLQALGVPVLPRLAHRLAMSIAQVSIGDPVIVEPGVYVVHGQVVIDGITEIHAGAVISPFVTIGLRAGDYAGPTIGPDVHIGTGAKVIGPVTVDARAQIGANAVVVTTCPRASPSSALPPARSPGRGRRRTPVRRTMTLLPHRAPVEVETDPVHPMAYFYPYWREARRQHYEGRTPRATTRSAVLTMVHDESVFLPIWLGYYSRYFGPEDIYVLDHQTTDGSTDAGGFVRIPVSHEGVDHTWMVRTIEGHQRELLDDYDVVLTVDVDEIVTPLPEWGTLDEYLNRIDEDFVNPMGYEVIHLADREPPFRPGLPILDQRGYWFANDAYSKPVLATEPLRWVPGFHMLAGRTPELGPGPEADPPAPDGLRDLPRPSSAAQPPEVERDRSRRRLGGLQPDRRRPRIQALVLRGQLLRGHRGPRRADPGDVEGAVLRRALRRPVSWVLGRADEIAYPEASSAPEQWQRVVMNGAIEERIATADPRRRTAVEISGDLHAGRPWKEYASAQLPGVRPLRAPGRGAAVRRRHLRAGDRARSRSSRRDGEPARALRFRGPGDRLHPVLDQDPRALGDARLLALHPRGPRHAASSRRGWSWSRSDRGATGSAWSAT